MINLEELKADHAAGTVGPWRKYKCACGDPICKQYTVTPQGSVGFYEPDADRIARLPELEAAYIEAVELLNLCAAGSVLYQEIEDLIHGKEK